MPETKNIIVDLEKIANPYSGLGQFSLELAKSLLYNCPEDFQVYFLIPDKIDKNVIPTDTQQRILSLKEWKNASTYFKNSIHLWHTTHQFPKYLPDKTIPVVTTIHDLNFLYEKPRWKHPKYLYKINKIIKRSSHIIAISDFTKNDIMQHFHDNGLPEISVIHNSYEIPIITEQKPVNDCINKPFLFSIGIFHPKKNFHLLVEMMRDIEHYQLVLAGDHQTSYGKFVKKLIRKYQIEDKIVLCGKITENEKWWYLKNCMALLFPSKAEGFGLPVLEGFAAGCPVILSNQGALKETGGDAAFYWSNLDPDTMAKELKHYIEKFNTEKDTYQKSMKQRLNVFNRSTAALQHFSLYRKLIE